MNKGEIPLRLTLGKQNIEAQAIAERFSCQYKVIRYSMSSEGPQLEQVIPTHWNSCRNSQLSVQRIPVTPPSHAVSSYPHFNLHEFYYSPNTCTLLQNVAQNLSAMWYSTFRIVEAQCPSITEITLKSPFLSVVWFSGLHKSYSCTHEYSGNKRL